MKRKPKIVDQAESRAAATALDLGPLTSRIGYVLRRAQLAVFADFFEAFRELGLRPAQYSVLAIVWRNPGVAQGRVAEALGIQKTNFVALAQALEAEGLVRRTASNEDRRVNGLTLTPKGRTLMARAEECVAAHEARMTARIGADAYKALFTPLLALAGLEDDG